MQTKSYSCAQTYALRSAKQTEEDGHVMMAVNVKSETNESEERVRRGVADI
jgi:hypothetical protein